ncbi:MAG: DNA polymerase III subunit gamma/tau [Desulfarculaceae bacterium]|nr:DNA polymerase III subunit gamma/tau [Desulfarculaceae bacterium]MCF8047603.1 DNA polymerase III subunit gamma/tau [Desulfarculaceae bacterium]MCF8123910.1 DNA polymerase III subunit gamma/tau [Desulfarculaceae bacterium]
MSYLVLARKHRPATFDEVVGQEHVTRTLAGALESGRLAHAFCFTGPRGVGKTTVARILAKALNCEHGPTATPCGKCAHCLEISEGRAVDVQEIDAASNSRVEDVRELREMIRYHPQSGRFRVTILDEVHMLSKAAFNALLKTLEEPPEHAMFILATTDVHKVPLTILSRCQRFDFRRLPPRVLAEHLGKVLAAEGLSLPAESLALMAREADGSVRDALSLLDQVLAAGKDTMTHPEVVELLGLVDRELVTATANAVLAGEAGEVLDLVSQVYAAGGEMQAFYAALQEHFRNLAAAKAAPEGADLFGLTLEEMAGLRTQAGPHSPETLHEIFDHLAASEDLFRRASQPRLVMEMTLLKLTQVKPVVSLAEIISGLERAGGGEGAQPQSRPKSNPAPAAKPAPAANPAPAGNPHPAPATVAKAPPPPPKAAPVAKAAPAGKPGDAEGMLKELVRYAEQNQPALASYLGRASAELQDGLLRVTLPPGAIATSYATEKNQQRLNRMAAELWDGGPKVRLSASAETVQAPDHQAQAAARAQAAGELAEHPVVRQAAEVFEAEVVALNPAGPDDKPNPISTEQD